MDAGANPDGINRDGSTPAIGCTYLTAKTSLEAICRTLSQLLAKGANLSLAKGAETPFKNLQNAADEGLLLP